MADNYVQHATGTGTTTAVATLSGVVAGNTIVAFFWDGSAPSPPATFSVADGQGAYTASAAGVNDGANAVFGRAFVLENANAGTHVVTGTGVSGRGLDIFVVEIGAPTTGATLGGSTRMQSNPGTASDAITSDPITLATAATLVSFSTCSSSITVGNTPSAGTGFTSRYTAVDSIIGAHRLETKGVAATAAGTFTSTGGATNNFVTVAVAIKNSVAAVGDQPVTRSILRGALKPGRGPLNTGKFRVSNAPAISTPLGANVTLALTGVSATFSAGSLGALIQSPSVEWGARPRPGRGPFSTGKFFVGSDIVYTASSANVTRALSGASATFSAGSLTPATSLGLIGQAAIFSAGTMSASSGVTVALSGAQATFNAGSLAPSAALALSGAVATFGAGALSASKTGSISLALSGASATFSAGVLSASGGDVIGSGGGYTPYSLIHAQRAEHERLARVAQKRREDEALGEQLKHLLHPPAAAVEVAPEPAAPAAPPVTLEFLLWDIAERLKHAQLLLQQVAPTARKKPVVKPAPARAAPKRHPPWR